jgi:hypothetical protein
VWFDEFDLLHLRSHKPVLRALVNQVGYELNGPKSAIVATNFFPTDSSTLNVQLVDASGKAALATDVPCAGRIYSGVLDDWGWYFWRFDFSKLDQPGTYRVAADYGDIRGESFAFVVDRGAVLKQTATAAVDFFFVQRCGCDVPGWHGPCHLEDGKAHGGPADGSAVRATGGWHDAGDYIKFVVTAGYATHLMLATYTRHPGIFPDENGNGAPDILDEARIGLDWLLELWDAKNRVLYYQAADESDHETWRVPERDKGPRPVWACEEGRGANVAGKAAASLALPIYGELTGEQQRHVVASIADFYHRAK